MSTINLELAMELALNNGCYMDDPQAYAILRYRNAWDGGLCFAVVYSKKDLERYSPSDTVIFPEIVWPYGCPSDIETFIEWRERHLN